MYVCVCARVRTYVCARVRACVLRKSDVLCLEGRGTKKRVGERERGGWVGGGATETTRRMYTTVYTRAQITEAEQEGILYGDQVLHTPKTPQ